jgi:hypothetical protein
MLGHLEVMHATLDIDGMDEPISSLKSSLEEGALKELVGNAVGDGGVNLAVELTGQIVEKALSLVSADLKMAAVEAAKTAVSGTTGEAAKTMAASAAQLIKDEAAKVVTDSLGSAGFGAMISDHVIRTLNCR